MPKVKTIFGIVALVVLVVTVANFGWLLGTNLLLQQQLNKEASLLSEAESILKLAEEGRKIAMEYGVVEEKIRLMGENSVDALALQESEIPLLLDRNRQLIEKVGQLKVSLENKPALDVLVNALNLQDTYLAMIVHKTAKDKNTVAEIYDRAVEAFNKVPKLTFRP